MAASANSIKKVMKLDRQGDGTLDMIIHIQRRPDGHAYVDGRPCGSFVTNPISTAQGVAETVAATVTEFMKGSREGLAASPRAPRWLRLGGALACSWVKRMALGGPSTHRRVPSEVLPMTQVYPPSYLDSPAAVIRFSVRPRTHPSS